MLEHGNVTIKKIAALAGVSRGTVDRVLNNRPDVEAQVRDKVLQLIAALEYRPNRAAKALGFNKKPLTLGVVMPREVPFFAGIRAGVDRAVGELQDFGLSVRIEEVSRWAVAETLAALERLRADGAQGLVVTAPDEAAIRTALDAAVARGVPVVTYNSDLPGSRRACFVGQDLHASGRIAAGLMAKMLPESATILVVTGELQYQAQSARLAGFREDWKGPLVVAEGREQRPIEEREVALALEANPGVRGVYLAAGSAEVVLSLLARRPGPRVRVVCNDLLPEVRAGLEAGTVDFTLLQDEQEQGYRPVRLLFEHLTEGTPLPQGDQLVTSTIVIKETLRRNT